jgi:hypothetical protein
MCRWPIRGEGYAPFGGGGAYQVPEHCENCGQPYPWKKSSASNSEKSEKPDTSSLRKAASLAVNGNKSLIKKIWTDPVGSQLIAGVLAAGGLYLLKLVPQLGLILGVQVKIPVWLIVAAILFVGLLGFGFGKKRTATRR